MLDKITRFLNQVHIPTIQTHGMPSHTIKFIWIEKNGLLHCKMPHNLWPTMNSTEVEKAPALFSQRAKDAGFSEEIIRTFQQQLKYDINYLGDDMFYNCIYDPIHTISDQNFLNVLFDLAEKYEGQNHRDNTSQSSSSVTFFNSNRNVQADIEDKIEDVIAAPGGPKIPS